MCRSLYWKFFGGWRAAPEGEDQSGNQYLSISYVPGIVGNNVAGGGNHMVPVLLELTLY